MVGERRNNAMPHLPQPLSTIISILWPYFWRSKDKLGFILNCITIYAWINHIGFVIIIVCLVILYFMSSNNLGPFHVGEYHWQPWQPTFVRPEPAQPAPQPAHMTITSESVQHFITDNHLKLTPKDYLPPMTARGFTYHIYGNGSYTCSE